MVEGVLPEVPYLPLVITIPKMIRRALLFDRRLYGDLCRTAYQSASYTFGTQGVEVEVDEETGEVKILKLVAALDVGRVLNPQTLKGRSRAASPRGSGPSTKR